MKLLMLTCLLIVAHQAIGDTCVEIEGCKCTVQDHLFYHCQDLDYGKYREFVNRMSATKIKSGTKVTKLILETVDVMDKNGRPFKDEWMDNLVDLEFINVNLTMQNLYLFTSKLKNLETLVFVGPMNFTHLKTQNPGASLPKLKKLTMSMSNLKSVDREFLKYFHGTELEFLNLENNDFDAVPCDVLAPLRSLKELNFNDNNINIVDKNEVNKLKKSLGNLTVFQINTLVCDCDEKNKDLSAWVEKQKITNVLCDSPAKVKDLQLQKWKKEDHCNGGEFQTSSSLIMTFIVVSLVKLFN